ncbi:MAG: sensor histidine kinase [Terracidiphilus sp.]|nr:sensor histidine kinase [Terracidiphilus sp.]
MRQLEKDPRQGTDTEMHDRSGQTTQKVMSLGVVGGTVLDPRLHGVSTFEWMGGTAQSFAEVAHDARNMVTALSLYCDLLEEPGVLSPSFLHYGSELKLLASASNRLVEKLMALNSAQPPLDAAPPQSTATSSLEFALQNRQQAAGFDPGTGALIKDFAFEIETNRNLLGALVGPGIEFYVDVEGGRLPVRMSSEDLTRILVNLVRNAAEAMRSAGRLQITLRELEVAPGADPLLLLSIEDNGDGVAPDMLDRIFEPGYTTRGRANGRRDRQGRHLGLGLSITRSIVEAAGGKIHAAARDPSGLCFQIELPVYA